jgi:hypothetical protein
MRVRNELNSLSHRTIALEPQPSNVSSLQIVPDYLLAIPNILIFDCSSSCSGGGVTAAAA